jgi:hypothetical protein
LVAILGIVGAAVFFGTRPPEAEPVAVGAPSPPAVVRPLEVTPPVAAVAEPPVEPARDAGPVARVRPVKPSSDSAKDPSDLELK